MESNINTDHHVQQELCNTRPLYRQGRRLTAVKVYTINNESSHLYVYGVPQIKLRNEVKTLFTKYGHIKLIHVVPDIETEPFTECYHIQFDRIQSARIAKRLVDNRNFYGGILHVCYTPEHETVEETRKKLKQRDTDVTSRLERLALNNKLKDVKSNCHVINTNYLNEVETDYSEKEFVPRKKKFKVK